MGVPDSTGSSGPARKRQRLSLKAIKKKQDLDEQQKLSNLEKVEEEAEKETLGSESSNSLTSSTMRTDSTYTSSYTDTTEVSSATLLRVPAVASLENTGNTCFMNSILQVLRYTPGFLDHLAILYQKILTMEKLRKKIKKSEDPQAEEKDSENQKNSWNVIKSVYKVYRDLSLLEEKYEEVATDDVMSMAAKPRKILQAVRVLNPMYEGSYQHDAQEFLRCFLAYMQDAEKEVRNFSQFIPKPFSPKRVVNPLMQKFLQSGGIKKEETGEQSSQHTTDTKLSDNSKNKEGADIDTAKVNLFSKLQGADVAKPSVQPGTGIVSEPNKAHSASPTKKVYKMVPKIGHTAENIFEDVKDIVPEHQTATMTPAMLPDGSVSNLDSSRATKSAVKDDSKKANVSEKAKKPNGDTKNNVAKKYIQPSIKDIYNTTYSKKKRLGMSRSVKKLNVAEQLFDEMKELEHKENTDGSNVIGESEVEDIATSKPDAVVMGPEHLKMSLLNGIDSILGGKTESDSEDEENPCIIHEKKIAKLIHESPRRSPRKSKSQMLIPSPVLVNKPDCSKSDCNIMKAKLNLSNFDSFNPCNNSCAISMTKNLTDCSMSPMETDLADIEKQNSPHDNKMVLEPIIKLENCDYVFKDNERSVSASYAMDCLSPSKNSPSKNCYSSNYLKQRNFLHTTSDVNTEELEKALEAMFNSPIKSTSNMDFIEQLFQGSMLLRTQCFSCDSSTERQEDFQDISVPVRIEKDDSDDDDDDDENKDKEESIEDKQCGLLELMEASTEVERLKADNKYYCDECKSYQDAERSIHYDVLPDILTLHLKRFSACSGNFGYISKINDAVDVPMTLPCMRYKCAQSCLRPDHKYKLYGIITHTGVTLTSGHYLAYVCARAHKDSTIYRNKKNAVQTINKPDPSPTNIETKPDHQPVTRGKSGSSSKLPSRFDENVVADTKVKAFASLSDQGKKSKDLAESLKTNQSFDTEWFKCDDETIRVFEEPEFLELLSSKQDSLIGTPYLLFYHKSTIC